MLYSGTAHKLQDHTYARADYRVEEFIRDLYDRAHISSGTLNQAISKYYTLLKSHKNNKMHLACYAVYITLSAAGIPRSLDEISVFSGIPKEKMWSIEKKNCYEYSAAPQSPIHEITIVEEQPPEGNWSFENSATDCVENYVERTCHDLKLNYKDVTTIKNIIKKLSGTCGVRANTLIATVLYLYCKELNSDVVLKKIALACNVTTSSIYKYIKKFDKKYVQHISLVLHEDLFK